MQFSIFEATHLGSREKNEDRMGYSYTREAGLFALADGVRAFSLCHPGCCPPRSPGSRWAETR